MQKNLIFSMLLCFAFLLAGCQEYRVKQTLAPVKPPSGTQTLAKIVILPFADYSSSNIWESWRKNVLINEALEDEFLKAGFSTVPQEDVNQFLLKKGIIKKIESYNMSRGLWNELNNDWSPEMKAEIWKAIVHNQKNLSQEKTSPLNQEIIQDLGKTFGARYIVRGRIVAFSNKKIRSLNPVQSGILPFVFKIGSRTIFGAASSDAYEGINYIATGGIAGGLIDASWEGAGIGAAAGALAALNGKTSVAKVQLRLYVQDAVSGEVVWTGRTEVEVAPNNIWTDKTAYELFAKAINEAVRSLVGSFALAYATGELPKPVSEKVYPLVEEAKAAANTAQAAAQRAEVAAERAEASAIKSERIFEKTLTK